MSSFSEHHPPSSSQFVPPESAQPYRSLFGGLSSDFSVPPSSLPEPPRRSIFGGPAQDVATEPDTEAELLDRGSDEDEDDELDMIMRDRPLEAEYGSDGESFKGSDEEANQQRSKNRVKQGSRGSPTTRSRSRSKTRSHSRSRSESPTKIAPEPATYVLDRGIDLPPGVERPNRWTGHSTTYRRLIADALATYEGLTTARSRDLAAHLYNAYMVRLQSKQTSQGLDEDGEEKTTISRRWGAWPLPPSRVPRPNEHMHEWFNDPDTIRMPPDPRPSAELEESIIAVMTRIAKENFLDRDWDYDEVRTNRSRSKGDPDAMTDEEDEKGAGAFSDPSFLQPALQTDDDVSRRQLRPLARNIITQIDSLLTSLQRSGNHRFTDREASDDSGPGTDDERPGETASSQNGCLGPRTERKKAQWSTMVDPRNHTVSRSSRCQQMLIVVRIHTCSKIELFICSKMSKPTFHTFSLRESVRDSTGTDMKAIVIENYLKDLGPLHARLDYCTLATVCQCALEGRGPPDLQDQVIVTITWQTAQMQRVGRLLEHLVQQGLITDVVDVEIANQVLADHREDVLEPLGERSRVDDKLLGLTNPPDNGHLMYPDEFDLDRVWNEVVAFLA